MSVLRLAWPDDVADGTARRAEQLLIDAGVLEAAAGMTISRLSGGANNMNFIATRDDRRWVLKMRSTYSQTLTTSLAFAAEAQRQAAQAGAAPRVYAANAEGDFLSEFVVGTTLRPDIFRATDCLAPVVAALQTVHTLSAIERAFDIFADVAVFSAEAIDLGGRLPDDFPALRAVADRFHAVLQTSGAPTGFLHGDLVPQNIMLCEDGVKFVDFDYCGTGMFAADLAILAAQAELDDAQTERVLALYDPALDDAQRARVVGIQFINTLREISWACAARCKVSDTTVLFDDWSYDYHEGLNRELAERILAHYDADDLARNMGQVRDGARF